MSSKTSDQENPAATVGDSEILSIKHPPASHIPPVGKGLEDDAKVLPTIASEQANDVFKDHPLGPYFLDDAADLPEQAGAVAGEAGACAHAGHVLARESADEHVDGAEVVGADLAHVGELPGVREPQRKHLTQVRLDFDLPGRGVSRLFKSKIKPSYPCKQTAHEGR
ncbi:hypothetical protein AVMA1855_23335 [Acidovorax sp. SUPP1855]|nr:hypothetical protein AVMA1855_23335 [Acidovorax sp. SUPP1855]